MKASNFERPLMILVPKEVVDYKNVFSFYNIDKNVNTPTKKFRHIVSYNCVIGLSYSFVLPFRSALF